MPSLVGGLNWLTKHSWEDHGDADILIHVLRKLLQPTSISGDAQAMHQTVIAMIAAPLETSLQELSRRVPNNQEIVALIELLKPHRSSQRSFESSIPEINQWCSTSNGGLQRAVRDLIGGLVGWSTQSTMNPMPTNYTHRMVAFALKTLSADKVLNLVVEEVKAQTQVGLGSSALEVATALVCSPLPMPSTSLLPFDGSTVHPSTHRRTLRQALRHQLEAPKELLNMETEYVEALVRLGRRVDAQSAVSSINPISMPMANLDSQDLMQDINMTGTDMSGTDLSGMQQQTSGLQDDGAQSGFAGLDQSLDHLGAASDNNSNALQVDLSDHLFDPSQDLSQFGMGNSSQSQGQNSTTQNTEDDIFGGLDMGDMGDDDFNFS